MPLTQEEKEAVGRYINRVFPGGFRCPVCGHDQRFNSDEAALPQVTSSKEIALGEAFHVVLIQCTHCGHLMMFSDVVLQG